MEYLLIEKNFSIQEHLVNNRYFFIKNAIRKKTLTFPSKIQEPTFLHF